MFFESSVSGKQLRWAAAVGLAAMLLLPATACLRSRADEKVLSAPERSAAQRLMVSQNCGTCHSLQDGDFQLHGTIGPPLSRRNGTRNAAWLRAQLTNPLSIPDHQVAEGYAGKQHLMPPVQLADHQLDLLIRYLQSLP
jgi:mono/diheme cytochrome c family protein